jgi:transcriptional regulator with GAF, ATPase, and Fis domain
LRERREDLGLLIQSLLLRIGADQRVQLSRQAARAVFLYPFPGNIRELERALGLAVTLADANGVIELEHLPEEIHRGEGTSSSARESGSLSKPKRTRRPGNNDDEHKARLLALLAQHRGQVANVARAMGKARMQIHRWIRRYEIDLESFRK